MTKSWTSNSSPKFSHKNVQLLKIFKNELNSPDINYALSLVEIQAMADLLTSSL